LPADIVLRGEDSAEVIEPVDYDPPADPAEAAIYNESLEGMLLSINAPAVVVGPSNRYGEFILVYEKWDTDLVRRTDEQSGFVMWVDDATFNSHDDQTTLPLAVARGDVVNEVLGPLAYTFGNYKIAPITQPDVQYGQHLQPALPEAAGNQFSVATFNVENLFDTTIPHPSGLPRLSEEEYQQRLSKVAQTIVALGAPAIVAMQEVENIGVLQELADQSLLTGYGYSPVLLEGNDSRGIDVGYLVRGDRATVADFAILDASNALFSRPPLMLMTTVHLDSGDEQVILLNNHFLSLSAGEVQTEPVRDNQAAWNAELVEQLAAENPEAFIIVLGDLNSFYRTKPLDTLQESGLRHAFEFFDDEEILPYTYIFEGGAQTLDHILMSESLFEKLSLVEALHTNADFPIPDPADSSPRRASDHDPLLVMFTFE
jgi:predicted extracellular nuclease